MFIKKNVNCTFKYCPDPPRQTVASNTRRTERDRREGGREKMNVILPLEYKSMGAALEQGFEI